MASVEQQRRTDRGLPGATGDPQFTEAQRLWLLERDLDAFERRLDERWSKFEKAVDERLSKMESQQRRISAAAIAILTFLVGSLALLVIQGGAG